MPSCEAVKLRYVHSSGSAGSPSGPSSEHLAILAEQAEKQQRRQGKLVDHMGLIPSSEVTDILLMRYVRLRQENGIRIDNGQDVAQQLHDFNARLMKMQARGARLFPKKCHGIQP